ncbi:hypothetical protein JCM11251_001529 [Rhodosporidiobolus azoricus]
MIPIAEGGRGTAKSKKANQKVGRRSAPQIALDNPLLQHLPPRQAAIIAEQIAVDERKKASFASLFRYHTRFELFLNSIGIILALGAGVAQPSMALFFGRLTTSFANYTIAYENLADDPANGAAVLEAARQQLSNNVDQNALLLLYVMIAMFVALYGGTVTWMWTGERAVRRLRESYLSACLRQNIAYQEVIGTGAITTRIETDMSLIQAGMSEKCAIIVMYLGMFFGGLIIGLVRNWRLALVVSVIVPLAAIAAGALEHFQAEAKRKQLDATAEGAEIADEAISSVRGVVAFGMQKVLAALYEKPNQVVLQLGIQTAKWNSCMQGTMWTMFYCTYALALWYGTTLILQGRADSGHIVTVLESVLLGAFALMQIAPNLLVVSNALGAAPGILATLDRIPSIDSASQAGLTPDEVHGRVEFRGVQFIYPSRPGIKVLHSFDAVFSPGKTTALVGASGSGKSTIVGLLERFYDPIEGSVKLDGVELKELNVKWLRNQIGLVSQEPTLFATTVAGNIEHGMIGSRFEHETPEQKRFRVVEAAKLANADSFIRKLPQGYDTKIGERGMLLSGGQKQRIAIARAIISDPKILLLDEATSALDSASEAIVQDALDRAAAGRTTITVAHRLSTIKAADQIIVLTAGNILESAMSSTEETAHQILLRNPEGAYSKLVGAQALREAATGPEAVTSSNTAAKDPDALLLEDPDAEEHGAVVMESTAEVDGDLEKGKQERPAKSFSLVYLLHRLARMNREERFTYVWGVLGAACSGATYPIFSLVFDIFSDTDRDALRRGGDRMALWVFIIGIIALLVTFVQYYAFSIASERLAYKLRNLIFRYLLRQDISYFDREENSTGHLTSAVSNWPEKINSLLGPTAGLVFQSASTLIVGIILGLVYAPKVAAVGIACLPFTLSSGFMETYLIFMRDDKSRAYYASSAQMAAEAAAAVKTVQALTREEDVCTQYSNLLETPTHQNLRFSLYSQAFYSMAISSTLGIVALLFWYGARQLMDGKINQRDFFVAIFAVVLGSIQAGVVFAFAPQISSARGATASLVKLLDAQPSLPAGDDFSSSSFSSPSSSASFENDKVREHRVEGHIQLDKVHFRFPTRPNVPVLQGLEMDIKPGQFCAIVGASGCGKSTTIQLIERFYDPLAGRLLIDSHDLRTLHLPTYRQSVALVSQEPTLYAGSVRFNVALGLAGAGVDPESVSLEEVKRACREANLEEFVEGLPEGYETNVGGKGTQFSGGQKQRVAIARALIRNPKILLLDEATSALDSSSERIVQAALDKATATRDRSTVAVAHRLSSVQNADRIFVVDGGRIVEKGTHWELVQQKGIYAELVSQQTLSPTA